MCSFAIEKLSGMQKFVVPFSFQHDTAALFPVHWSVPHLSQALVPSHVLVIEHGCHHGWSPGRMAGKLTRLVMVN